MASDKSWFRIALEKYYAEHEPAPVSVTTELDDTIDKLKRLTDYLSNPVNREAMDAVVREKGSFAEWNARTTDEDMELWRRNHGGPGGPPPFGPLPKDW